MRKQLRALVLAVAFMGGALVATAQVPPNIYFDQSNVLGNYLLGVPTNGGLVWPTPNQVWANIVGGVPDYSGFMNNLGIAVTTQAWGDPAQNMFQLLTNPPFNGVVPIFLAMTDAQAAIVIQDLQVFGFTAEQAAALVGAARGGAAGGVTPDKAAALVAMLRGAAGAALAQMREDAASTLRRNIGGFSPFSAPVILSRGMMKGRLRGASPVPGSAWGVNTWMQNNQVDDGTDSLSLGGQPFMRRAKGNVTWSVSAPVLYAYLEDVAHDDQWSGGLDGTVEFGSDNGFFIGAHGAFVDNYAEMLDKNNFLSLSGGPYVGMSHTIDERLALTAMALTEGISTEKTDDTWYVAGGAGVSYRITKAVTLNLFGLYYANMDTYTKEDDRDFVEVGAGLEAAVAENTAVQVDFSKFCFADQLHSFTVSLNLVRGF